MKATAKAAGLLGNRTTAELINDFILTGSLLDNHARADWEALTMVRGWIMDELQARDPDAFNAWVESYEEDTDLWKYFRV